MLLLTKRSGCVYLVLFHRCSETHCVQKSKGREKEEKQFSKSTPENKVDLTYLSFLNMSISVLIVGNGKITVHQAE